MDRLRSLPCLRVLCILSILILCYADADKDKHKDGEKEEKETPKDEKAEKEEKGAPKDKKAEKEEKKASKQKKQSSEGPEVIGPAKYGSPTYWVKVKGMGFSEGNLVPDFNENKTDYTLTIHNGKAKQLLTTVQLDTDKYDLLELPELVWNGKKMKYSPIETIEFKMPLNESIGAFQQDATLTCKDKKEGSFFSKTNSRTYTIHVIQIPDIEQIVTAKNITVTGVEDHKYYEAHPPYRPETKENEITYFVDHKVKKVQVRVQCPPEASQLKINGIPELSTDATYTSHEIEGASKQILAQCMYKDPHWTNGKEMQRTYVVKILRNQALQGTNVSIRIWPPSQGLCKTKVGVKHGAESDADEVDYSWSCMGYTRSVPLLGTYTEEKAELYIVNTENGAKYRLWNGIPSHIPLEDTKNYEVHLVAGKHIRKYKFILKGPPKCFNVDCQKGTHFKNRGYPDLFRWWSNGSTRERFCKWDPCTIQDDFVHCCSKKGATCDSYRSCMDPSYRAANRDVCPHDDDWKFHGNIIYEYDYSNKTTWKCPKKLGIVQSERCAWTPCRPEDNDDGHCCGEGGGVAACRTISCPSDKTKRSSALNKLCQGSVCGPVDYDTCCTTRDVCTSMKCPKGYGLKYNAALFMCAGENCTSTDREQCCDSASYCDSWTCPPFWELKKDAPTIACGGNPCMEWDTGLCCNRKGMCSTLDCPVGYFKKDHASTTPCAGIANRTCNLAIDLYRCCEKNEICSMSRVCDKHAGYVLKRFAKDLSCPGPKCKDTDRNLCCDMVDPFKVAANVIVGPRTNEGSCFSFLAKTDEDGAYHFMCTPADGIDALHLRANFTFSQPVGNETYFGEGEVISGRTASYPLKELPVLARGKKYILQMHSRAAGRIIATGKISVFVVGYQERIGARYGTSSGATEVAESSSAASDSEKEATKSSAASDTEKKVGKSSEASEERESVLRKLSTGKQLSALVSASSRACIAVAIVIVSFAKCAF